MCRLANKRHREKACVVPPALNLEPWPPAPAGMVPTSVGAEEDEIRSTLDMREEQENPKKLPASPIKSIRLSGRTWSVVHWRNEEIKQRRIMFQWKFYLKPFCGKEMEVKASSTFINSTKRRRWDSFQNSEVFGCALLKRKIWEFDFLKNESSSDVGVGKTLKDINSFVTKVFLCCGLLKKTVMQTRIFFLKYLSWGKIQWCAKLLWKTKSNSVLNKQIFPIYKYLINLIFLRSLLEIVLRGCHLNLHIPTTKCKFLCKCCDENPHWEVLGHRTKSELLLVLICTKVMVQLADHRLLKYIFQLSFGCRLPVCSSMHPPCISA